MDYHITVDGHEWSRSQTLDKYQEQSADDWGKNISENDYNDFSLIRTEQKEAPWDSYQHDTGRDKEVEDLSKCEKYNSPKTTCTTPKEVCEEATINGVKVKGNCRTPAPVCTTPEKICLEYGTKLVDVFETRYREHPYIYFTYMDWDVIDTLTSWEEDKNPYWRYAENHEEVNNNPLLYRYSNQRETYNIVVSYDSGGTSTIQLPRNTWDEIEKGIQCDVQGTRLGGVSTDNLLNVIKDCK